MSRTIIFNGVSHSLAVASIDPATGEITVIPFSREIHSTTYFDSPIAISSTTTSDGSWAIRVETVKS